MRIPATPICHARSANPTAAISWIASSLRFSHDLGEVHPRAHTSRALPDLMYSTPPPPQSRWDFHSPSAGRLRASNRPSRLKSGRCSSSHDPARSRIATDISRSSIDTFSIHPDQLNSLSSPKRRTSPARLTAASPKPVSGPMRSTLVLIVPDRLSRPGLTSTSRATRISVKCVSQT